MIEYKVIALTFENILALERIRLDAYQMKTQEEDTFYARDLVSGNYFVVGCFFDGEFIGGAYIKNTYSSLYVDQLFILKKYQNHSYHFGTLLLSYILENKKLIEEYFQTTFIYSYLDNGPGTQSFYEKFGYVKKNNLMRKYL